jgi:zinc transport system substrate-binding protein
VKFCLRPVFFFLLICFTGLFVSPCFGETIPAIASIFPVADMVRRVGGENVEVTLALPAGASPHTFEPKPSLAKKFSTARIFFMIGAGLEYWAEKFVKSTDLGLKTVIFTKEAALIYTAEGHNEIETGYRQNHSGSSEPELTMANPHIWLDPVVAKSMVKKIIAALCEVDYHHEQYYRQRGQRYLDELDDLHRHIKAAVETFRIKKYVSYHDSWAYFARRYGLESVGVIEASPGRNPTPIQIKKIVSRIKEHRIRAVFAEPQFNPRAAEVVAKEADIQVLFLDPMGGPTLKYRDTYIDLMKYNLSIFQEAME